VVWHHSSSSSLIAAACCHHCHSTRDPPHEQLLVGWGRWCVIRHVVLVLGSLVVVPIVPIGGGGVMRPIAPKPPCEQVLAGVGGGCWCLPSLVSLTPRVHTHKPPYEQLLVGVVAGAVSSPGPPSVGH